MRYADTLLIDGEEVALRTRQHWLALLITARLAFVLWGVGLALLVAGVLLNQTAGQIGAQLIGGAVLLLFAIGLVIFVIRLWQWWAQDYMITNRRLMKVWGVLNKRSVDSSLEKVNDARLDQSMFGRIFNYGHLDILTASTETDLDDYDMIKDPKGFKKIMLTQKHNLEMSYNRGAPSPPMRAAGMDMNGEPAAPATGALRPAGDSSAAAYLPLEPRFEPAPTTAPMGGEPAPQAEPPPQASPAPGTSGQVDRSLEITQTLARLADLRDRGALTAEDYEAKKRELLDRL